MEKPGASRRAQEGNKDMDCGLGGISQNTYFEACLATSGPATSSISVRACWNVGLLGR